MLARLRGRVDVPNIPRSPLPDVICSCSASCCRSRNLHWAGEALETVAWCLVCVAYSITASVVHTCLALHAPFTKYFGTESQAKV